MKENYEVVISDFLDTDWIEKKRKELGRLVVNQIRKPDLTDLKKGLEQKEEFEYALQDYMSLLLETVEEKIAQEIETVFKLGTLFDVWEQCEHCYDELNKKQQMDIDTVEEQTVYKDQILKILWEKAPILHRDLAEELQISPSNLSNVMKRMKNASLPLVDENIIGKNKFYQLNLEGRQYVKEKMKPEESVSLLVFQKFLREYRQQKREISEKRFIKYTEPFPIETKESWPGKMNVTFHCELSKLVPKEELEDRFNIHSTDGLCKQFIYRNSKWKKETIKVWEDYYEKNVGCNGRVYKECREKLEKDYAEVYPGECRR